MNLWKLAWRYTWNRPLVTILTIVGVGLGAGLVSSILTIRREFESALIHEGTGFDVIVGAKGSPLQLVLSSLYHVDSPTGNIDHDLFLELKNDRRSRQAIPLALGDNYAGFRIVGTNLDAFASNASSDETSASGSEIPSDLPWLRVEKGLPFARTMEAVIGVEVARRTGLQIGSEFHGSHGLTGGIERHREHPLRVVGILTPSGTANDRAIFTSITTIWKVHDHPEEDDKDEEAHADGNLEVTAVLIRLKSAAQRFRFIADIQKRTSAMAADPLSELLKIRLQFVRPLEWLLLRLAYLVVMVAALTILTTLYQAGERRRREVAILRSMGATRFEVSTIALLEAVIISSLGIGIGWLLGHGGSEIFGSQLRQDMGLTINAWSVDAIELKSLGAVLFSGTIAGLIPAWISYRRDPVRDLESR